MNVYNMCYLYVKVLYVLLLSYRVNLIYPVVSLTSKTFEPVLEMTQCLTFLINNAEPLFEHIKHCKASFQETLICIRIGVINDKFKVIIIITRKRF